MTEADFVAKFDSQTKSLYYKRKVVELIIDLGPETLPSIAKELEVSIPTASKLVSEMVDTGLLMNYGKLETSGGRHPVLFGLNPDNCFFVGIDFEPGKMNIVLMNFCGTQVQEKMGRPFTFDNTQECLDELISTVNKYLDEECMVQRDKVVSIGINIFGRLNPETGYSYTYFNFSEVPLGKVLSDRIGIPTFIDNDSRACAYGEYMMHYRDKGKNLLFVNCVWGLGLGIIVDGQPYSGKSGFSGEFGHIHVYDNEIICHCGKKGCLETEASGSAMYRKFINKIEQGGNSILLDPAGPFNLNINDVTLDHLIEAVQREDILCIEILEEVGESLGTHVAGLINLFNPNIVVIGGSLAKAGDFLMQPLRSAIRKYSLNMVNQDTALNQSLLMKYAGVMGACMLARKKSVERLSIN